MRAICVCVSPACSRAHRSRSPTAAGFVSSFFAIGYSFAGKMPFNCLHQSLEGLAATSFIIHKRIELLGKAEVEFVAQVQHKFQSLQACETCVFDQVSRRADL